MTRLPQPAFRAMDPEGQASLRSRAATRLTGAAGTWQSTARAGGALSVLHTLASSPATASDALALLHELQVHQVELDLQAQELEDARAELEAALHRQIERYDAQPAGCLTIDRRMALYELNLTAAGMLGISRDAALGSSLDAFLGIESARKFRSAVAQVDRDGRRASCRLTLRAREGAEYPVVASIGRDPAADRYLVNLTDEMDGQEHPTPLR